jgi:UDP-N-acetylglucosamine acyltransferase
MPQIHPTAIVAPGAHLADDVEIGPYCVIGENVELAAGVSLKSHVVIDGRTTIGERTRIFPFASIGHEPQDLKYRGEPSSLEIGHDNTIRENVTINPGTEGGGLVTRMTARSATTSSWSTTRR